MMSKSEWFENRAVQVLKTLNVSEEEMSDISFVCGILTGVAICKLGEEADVEELIFDSERLSEENKAALFKLYEDLETITKSNEEGS